MHTFYLTPEYQFDEKNEMNYKHYRNAGHKTAFIATLQLFSVVLNVCVLPSAEEAYVLIEDKDEIYGEIVKMKLAPEIVFGHPNRLELFLLNLANRKILNQKNVVNSKVIEAEILPEYLKIPHEVAERIALDVTDVSADSFEFKLTYVLLPERTSILLMWYYENLSEKQSKMALELYLSAIKKYCNHIQIIEKTKRL